MDDVAGWKLDQEDLSKRQLLWHIAEHGRLPDLCTFPDWAQDTSSDAYVLARSHLSEFEAAGLLDVCEKGAMPNLGISGRGLAVARRLQELRADRQARDAGLHDALLAWLDDEALQGNAVPVISGFSESRFGRWFGEPFLEREIAAATEALRSEEMIGGSGSLGHGIIRPSLKPKGRRLSRSGRSFFDDASLAGGDTFHINQTAHNLSSQIAGRESTQTMTVTLSAEDQAVVADLVDALRQIAATAPDSGADDAADDLQAAASSRDLGVLQRAIVGAQGAAFAAIGTDLGDQAVRLAHELLRITH